MATCRRGITIVTAGLFLSPFGSAYRPGAADAQDRSPAVQSVDRTESQEPKARLRLVVQLGHSLVVQSVAFSPDGRYVLTGGDDTRLWDVATGAELRKFEHYDRIVSVAFSPDGRHIFAGSDDGTARLWDVATGARIRKFGHAQSDGHEGVFRLLNDAILSPDGCKVVTVIDGTAQLWEVTTGKEIRKFEGIVSSFAFSPDGRQVLTGGENTARLWDVATGAQVRKFEWLASNAPVAFSPDGQQVVSGSFDGTARVWDITTGAQIRKFEGHSERVWSVAFSPDGRHVLTGSGDHTARLWDVVTGAQTRRFEGYSHPVEIVAFSPDGWPVLTGNDDDTAWLWHPATGAKIRRFKGHICSWSDGQHVLTESENGTSRLWDVATGTEIREFKGHPCVAADRSQVLTRSNDGTGRLWDVATGAEIGEFEWGRMDFWSVALSHDGRHVLTGNDARDPLSFFRNNDGTARLWDVATRAEIRRFVGHSDDVCSVAFSPGGRHVLTGSDDRTARLWDAATGAEIRKFDGHYAGVWPVTFSPDGRHALATSSDHTARLWRVETGRELCALVMFRDGSWAVVDPQRRFDASNGGDVNGLHWVVGNEPIELAQLKERYHEPGLLAKLMGFNKEPLRDVTAFDAPVLYPDVKLAAPTKDSGRLGINLTNRGGGIGRVVVKVNGKEIAADARGPGHDPDAEQLSLQVELPSDHRLLVPGEENVIEVQAVNAEGYLRSRGLKVLYKAPPSVQIERPRLWAVVAGVSDYLGDAIDLRFAAKDAADYAAAPRLAATRLFGPENVLIAELTTSGPRNRRPTRATIVRALDIIGERSTSSDILVVYLAGHGVNYGGQDGDFYFLGSEARTADLSDPAVRRSVALSSAKLTELINQIPANKQVMILDTCASGKLIEKLTEKRHVPGSQIRALERLKDRTGMHVLAGCATDAVSYEATRYAQGVLTYSLLLGMRGAALKEDQFVDVSTLFSFAADRVPELARDVGGIQRPVIATPKGGTSFDIGQLSGEDRAAIPLQLTRPLVLRTIFQEEESFDDVLALAKRLDELFRDTSARGHDANFVFVDARELPDSYRLRGRYRIDDGNVEVEARLFQQREAAAEFSIRGKQDNIDDLASKILQEVQKHLKGHPVEP